VLGAEREFCCAGCEAVARTIAGAGFERYYETRTAPAERPAEKNRIAEPAGAEASLILEHVRCAACLWLIEQVLRRHPGVTHASVTYATQRAQVRWAAEKTSLAAIVESIRSVGYDACPYDPRTQDELERKERRAALWRLFVAGFGAMQVMMYAFPAYVDEVGAEAALVMRWASLLITLPVLAFSWPVLLRRPARVQRRQPDRRSRSASASASRRAPGPPRPARARCTSIRSACSLSCSSARAISRARRAGAPRVPWILC
jgi:Cu2+-exporting ATPase